MRRLVPWVIGAVLASARLAFALPAGSDHFALGWTRAQVDSALAARGLGIVSDRAGVLASTSDDPAIEFEQYLFYPTSHGPSVLWKVTLAYRVPYAYDDFSAVVNALESRLGKPSEQHSETEESTGRPLAGRMTWVDPNVSVRLGGRWPNLQDARADRMLVTWIDRRLQRLIDAKRRQERKTSH